MKNSRKVRGTRLAFPALPLLLVADLAVADPGAWPQAAGKGQAISTLTFSRSFSPKNAFGQRSRFTKAELGVFIEYGLTDTLTIGALPRFEFRENRFGMQADTNRGLSDSDIFLRSVLWRDNASVLSLQGTVIVPGGYDRRARLPLGDGAFGYEARLLAGHNFKVGEMPAFVELQVGYRFRAGSPADIVKVDATLGLRPADKWLILLQSLSDFSVRNQGTGGTDFDVSKLQISVVREIAPNVSIQLGAYKEIYGRNLNRGAAVLTALWIRF
ncbi:MAG: hypothetical protein ACRC7G_13485 [Beijerinckiaceae bacterium]